MVKVIVRNLQNKITHSTTHDDQQAAEAWVEANKSAFGKIDRWLEPSQFTDAESTITSEDSRVVEKNGVNVTEYFFRATYGVLYLDVSQQAEDTLAIHKTLRDQENGRHVIAKIKAMNERKNLNFAGLQALLADQNLWIIERLLHQGSVQTALSLIKVTQTDLFTSQEKQEIMLFIESLGYDLP